MFTGIIETLGTVKSIEKEGSNLHYTIESDFTNELKIDQSVSHNGVCLTVVDIVGKTYKVTAIQETLLRTTLSSWKVNDPINLERGMKLGDRLDGHIVQGHVDTTGKCIKTENLDGSIAFHFEYEAPHLTVEKGSITINGVSLTVVDSTLNTFSVCIIPYTLEHTTFKNIQVGSTVNLEFDIIGKYFQKQIQVYKDK
jgi:riboflavin synthase